MAITDKGLLAGDLLAPQSGAAASTAAAGGLPKDSLFGGLDVGGRGSQAAAGPSVASQGSLLEGLDFGTPAPSGSQQNGNAAGLQGGLPGFAAGPALGGTSAAPPPPMEGGFFTGLSVPGGLLSFVSLPGDGRTFQPFLFCPERIAVLIFICTPPTMVVCCVFLPISPPSARPFSICKLPMSHFYIDHGASGALSNTSFVILFSNGMYLSVCSDCSFLSFPFALLEHAEKCCCTGRGWLAPDLVGNDSCTWQGAGSAAKGPGTVDGVVDLLGGLAMGPSPSQAPPHSNLLGVGGGLAQHPMAPTGLGTPGAAPFGGSAQGLGGGPSLGPRMANAGPAFPGPAGVVHMGAHGMYPGAPGVGPQSGYSAVHYMPQGPGLQGGYGGTALLGTGMPYGGALPSQEVSTYGGLTSTNPGGRALTVRATSSSPASSRQVSWEFTSCARGGQVVKGPTLPLICCWKDCRMAGVPSTYPDVWGGCRA